MTKCIRGMQLWHMKKKEIKSIGKKEEEKQRVSKKQTGTVHNYILPYFKKRGTLHSSGIQKKLHRMVSVVTLERGDSMKIGFIGAGKAGCSLGKYFAVYGNAAGLEVSGYYSLLEEEARWAEKFTQSKCFKNPEEVVCASDITILSTPDGAVSEVWDTLDKKLLAGKIICHLSGSLSSDVFSNSRDYGVEPISIHPMFAFSNKESVYEQLKNVSFTLEGSERAVTVWRDIFSRLGNPTIRMEASLKGKYHAAASILSNHVIAVLATGYELLMECGFSKEEARSFSQTLVMDNVEHVIKDGVTNALTGPIERGDTGTVNTHFSVLNEEQAKLYRACGRKLLKLAKEKNPGRDYSSLEELF